MTHIARVEARLAPGVAQKTATIGAVEISIPAADGMARNGQETGRSWATGLMVPIRINSCQPAAFAGSLREVSASLLNNVNDS
jgi:hypothetical protein